MKIVGCDYSSSLTNGLINHITDPRDRLNQDQLDLDIIEDNDIDLVRDDQENIRFQERDEVEDEDDGIDLVRNEQVNIHFQERDEVGVNATQNENPSLLEMLKEEELVLEMLREEELVQEINEQVNIRFQERDEVGDEDDGIDLVRNEQVNIRFQERDEVGDEDDDPNFDEKFLGNLKRKRGDDDDDDDDDDIDWIDGDDPNFDEKFWRNLKRKRGDDDDDDDDIDNVRKQRVHSFMERVKVDNVNLFDHPMFEQTFGGDGGPRGDRPRGDRPRRPIIIPNPFMKREKIDRFGMIKDHSLESIVEDGVWILGINRKDENTSFINDCWRRLIDRFNRGHKGRRLSIPTIRDHNHMCMLSIYSEESYRIFGDCGDPAGVYPILKDLCNRIRHDEHFQIDDAVNKLIDCMGLINY